MVFELKCVHFVTGVETPPRLVRAQWDALNLLKQLDFSVNDDNRKFASFDDALHYATRYHFSLEITTLQA